MLKGRSRVLLGVGKGVTSAPPFNTVSVGVVLRVYRFLVSENGCQETHWSLHRGGRGSSEPTDVGTGCRTSVGVLPGTRS